MSFDYIRSYYGVPARAGGRVAYTGDRKRGEQQGTITGARGQYLLVKLDGEKSSAPFHPTWEMRLLNPKGGDSDV